MSAPSDQRARPNAQSDSARAGFLKTELELGFTFSSLAAAKYDAGNPASAKGSMACAEQAYQTVHRFLSDPKHFDDLTVEEIQRMRVDLERLRDTITEMTHRLERLGPIAG